MSDDRYTANRMRELSAQGAQDRINRLFDMTVSEITTQAKRGMLRANGPSIALGDERPVDWRSRAGNADAVVVADRLAGLGFGVTIRQVGGHFGPRWVLDITW